MLKVAVYQPQPYQATASIISFNVKGCTPPATNISAPTLEDQLNKIFDQAAITYNLGLHPKSISVKPGGTDCILDLVDMTGSNTISVSQELMAVDKKALDLK